LQTLNAIRRAFLLTGWTWDAIGSYLEGTASLRIISGTHQLRIVQGNQVLLDEKFYAGDGVNRTFIVQ